MHDIIHADCLDVMRSYPDQHFDLCLTDAPYGINIARTGHVGNSRTFTKKDWDSAIPTREYFDEMRRVSKQQIIWGGNYFTDHLPASRCWLVWYKKDGLPRNTFADCELAWTSFDRNALVYNCRWAGFVKDSKDGPKLHPTMKALEVMKWCVREFSREGQTILDPYCGSGSTLVAAAALGRKCTGIEIDAEYVAIARARLALAA